MSHELADFLRARRADAGLEPPTHGTLVRRRVTGLRREEVATAAGISVDYYTRLEQGRETNPSDAVLDSLAQALRLGPDAVDHLYALRASGTAASRRGVPGDPSVVERMATLVDAVRPNPAYVLDRLGNVVAINDEGLALFDGLADLEPEERNTCRYLMTHPQARVVFLDWEEVARGTVAHLRAANADNLDDGELAEMVAELGGLSPRFAQWWTGHLVERRRSAAVRVRRDDKVSTHQLEVLHLPEERLRMTLWLPAVAG